MWRLISHHSKCKATFKGGQPVPHWSIETIIDKVEIYETIGCDSDDTNLSACRLKAGVVTLNATTLIELPENQLSSATQP